MRHRTTLKCPAISLAMLLTAVLSGFTARAAQLTAVRTYDTSAVTLGTRTAPDGTQFQTVEWGDLYPAAEVGSPELPVEHFRFLVPVYTDNFRATVVSATGATALPLGSRVMPAQVPQKADGSPAPGFTYPDAEAYARVYSPEAWVVDDGFIDGCNHIVTVAVRPVSYDDATLTASAYGNVVVRLDYDLCGADGLTGSAPIFPPYASRYVNVGDLVVNAADVAQFAPRRAPKATDGDYGKNYYIIVPKDLEDAVEDLRIWKRQKGYNVIVKTIEDICATPRYAVGGTCTYGNGMTEQLVDSAASLRAYLHDEFDANGAYFCLLVGNSKTSMPIRKSNCDHRDSFATHKGNNSAYVIPTDNYFSDLTQIWNLTKEFEGAVYTVYCADLPYNPDIYVGRLLCNKPEEIANYMEKLILYESNPGYGDNDYLGSAFLFNASDAFPNSFDDVRAALNDMFNLEIFDDTGTASFPTGKQVIDKMSQAGFSSWHGHGNPYGVRCAAAFGANSPHYITSMDCLNTDEFSFDELHFPTWISWEDGNGIDKLKNRNKPSIAYSVSCDNTPFDLLKTNSWEYDSTYNLGEAFTVVTKCGGVAFLGNTRSGYAGESATLEEEFLRQASVVRKIGISEAVSKYLCKKSDRYSRSVSCAHNLIGEPEFEMWLGKPDTLDFNYKYTDNGINILMPVPSVDVSVFDGTGEVVNGLFNGRPVRGFASELTKGDFAISAWQSGNLPVISYFGQNNVLTNISKRFIVRDAVLGSSWVESNSSKFGVGLNAILSVYAIDRISSTVLFEVEDGGTVDLKCDKEISLEGSAVKNGGKLTVEGENVILGPGFKVEKGGIIQINMK